MPDTDGFGMVSAIRKRPLSKHTPILFLAADAAETDLTRAYALGAVDYMPRPVQPAVLKAKVAVFADLFRNRVEVRRQAELLRDAESRLRHQAEHALRESEGRFQVLCTAAPVAIFQLDVSGRCVYASPVWHEATGEPPESASGFGWADVVSGHRGAETLAAWQAAVDQDEPWSCESQYGTPKATRWVHVRTSPIASDTGKTIGHVGTVEDITARKLTEARLIDADRRKDEFLAMLAHELRNPLAAMSSAVTVAQTPHLEREHDWSIAVIGRHVRQLETLIDDLMDVSRITMAKIEMRRTRLDLVQVLARAADAVRARVTDRHQHLHLALPLMPLWTDADPTRLEQVFVNLLGNASKYSHDGGRIWFSAEAVPGGLEVRVRDEGIGLDPPMAERVFDLFAQAQTGLDRAKGGLGIGLSLAQRLTELHGGSIRVQSKGLGHGAEFVVTLPRAGALAPVAEQTADDAPATTGPGTLTRVLLVDDNVDATRALALLLDQAGFAVVTAHDGGEALERAAEMQPDIVLLDLGLPVVDGYRVAETLRARAGGEVPLLVAISGYGQPDDRRRSKGVGFDHHLVKPVDCAELIALMRAGAGSSESALPSSSSGQVHPMSGLNTTV